MGNICVPYSADFIFVCNKLKTSKSEKKLSRSFNFMPSYKDNRLSPKNVKFGEYDEHIYHSEP